MHTGFVAITAEQFRQHYESLSDEALLDIDVTELVPAAQACHAEEVARRGLDEQDTEEDNGTAEELEANAGADGEEAPVCIAEYDHLDEADLARGMLEAEEIVATLESEPGVVRLMVPATSAEQALRMLAATPLSDEELAAQAEAAGLEEDEP